jgi:hypothetical protein
MGRRAQGSRITFAVVALAGAATSCSAPPRLAAPVDDGTCGSTCAGRCSTGRCEVALSSAVSCFVVDDAGVYWSSGDTVSSQPATGGAVVTLATSEASPCVFAVDATDVYWIDHDGAVMRGPKAGGAAPTWVHGAGAANALAIDATNLYWIDDSGVMAASLSGGAPTMLAADGPTPMAIAVDDANVYWTNGERGTVKSVPKAGGAVTLLAEYEKYPWSLAVDATSVYWAEEPTASVHATPKGGGPITTLGMGDGALYGMTIDDASVYFTSFHSVIEVPKQGSGSMTLPSLAGSVPFRIAVSSTSVYWLDDAATLTRVTPK